MMFKLESLQGDWVVEIHQYQPNQKHMFWVSTQVMNPMAKQDQHITPKDQTPFSTSANTQPRVANYELPKTEDESKDSDNK